MGIQDYIVKRDHFDEEPHRTISFPCCCCKNQHQSQFTHPCNSCDHNLSAQPEEVVRGANIEKTGHHDAGAYARCSYCGRYSDKQASLHKDDYPCDCGKLHGWSGSFKKPTADAIWSEA